MNEIVVLSGKGGTGKTSIVGSFAVLARSKVLADCDVDAADLHLILSPEVKETSEFRSSLLASIDQAECTRCGLCQDLCRFHAIHDYTVDPLACEGCGFCSNVCPDKAITMVSRLSGYWYISETRFGTLVHARLEIGGENSGRLVSVVRQNSRALAAKENMDTIITDGPPGIGCPVISSLSGATLALLVTEPTLSGIHDLERVLGVCRHFGVPACVCINKHDINEDNTHQIESYCASQGLAVAGRIPFDNSVTGAIMEGVPVVEYSAGRAAREIEALWKNLEKALA